ncbi:hypothetical protein A3860_17970 [Niastella vici]|uniref:Uncharacterized protein n=1 Tax=Niastella vici TaxID=1703345 RepID=A0A1V9G4I2_9BACT|nr:hypothetical protein [Niastella vici]OQP65551.1 hypothetical protein A3860_17970 [Niastella vici]
MILKINAVSDKIEKEINVLVDHLHSEFGCVSTLSNEFPSNEICIALEVSMPANQTIFIPSTKKVRVFSINMKNQTLTLMYFPDSSEKNGGSENEQLMCQLTSKRNIHLHDLLMKSYEKLAECTDSSFDNDSWRSEEQEKLMDDIADALNIAEKDRL